MNPAPRIAIVAAMREELQTLLDAMPDERPVSLGGRDFYVGHLDGHDVVVVLSRIGKVAAATTAASLILHFGVRSIVFTGVAGGLRDGVRVGDVVVADTLLQHDLDASPIFPKYEVPLYRTDRFAPDPAMSAALAGAAQHALTDGLDAIGRAHLQAFGISAPRVHRGLIVSGDRFVSTAGESASLKRALPEALAVEMEGAALAQVCHDFGVPFAVVRTISDRADDDAHVDFTSFIREVASAYSLAIVRRLLRAWPALPMTAQGA